jgi:hypothetical protein
MEQGNTLRSNLSNKPLFITGRTTAMVSSFTVSVLETKRLSVLIVTSMFSAIICHVCINRC